MSMRGSKSLSVPRQTVSGRGRLRQKNRVRRPSTSFLKKWTAWIFGCVYECLPAMNSMIAFDTNVLLYVCDKDDQRRHECAVKLLRATRPRTTRAQYCWPTAFTPRQIPQVN